MSGWSESGGGGGGGGWGTFNLFTATATEVVRADFTAAADAAAKQRRQRSDT